MTIDKSRYPANWDAISLDIRVNRAGGKCEWCGVPNGASVFRKHGTAHYLLDMPDGEVHTPDGSPIRLSELPDGYDYDKPTRIVLTVHHIGIDDPDGRKGDPHDKMDVRPDNLAALCQRCHLLADGPIHVANARKTRLRKKAEKIAAAGQKSLFEDAS